jgi:type I restriction enzyme R subunit
VHAIEPLTGSNQQVADRLLTPFNHEVGKGERYYAQLAVNRTMEAILKGQRRLLLTMATGTGKTAVAFQLCWKLWNARWNRTSEYRRPRILYLADRNILVDQPKDGIFVAFGDARYKIESGDALAYEPQPPWHTRGARMSALST